MAVCQAWWHVPAILALWKLRQVDCFEFKVNLDYRVSCSPASTIESDGVSKVKECTFPCRHSTEVHTDHTGLQPEEQS